LHVSKTSKCGDLSLEGTEEDLEEVCFSSRIPNNVRSRLLEIAAKARIGNGPSLVFQEHAPAKERHGNDTAASEYHSSEECSETVSAPQRVNHRADIPRPETPTSFEWKHLDAFAKHIEEKEASRKLIEKREAQIHTKADLDKQMADLHLRKQRERVESMEYYSQISAEVAKHIESESRASDERRRLAEHEKAERDEQLRCAEEKRREQHDRQAKQDRKVMEQIQTDLERERLEVNDRREREKMQVQRLMEENEKDRLARSTLKKKEEMEELEQLRKYHDILKKQETEREQELQKRVERQKSLMKRMEETVTRTMNEKSKDDDIRALKQQAEIEERYIKLERLKADRVNNLRNEMKQMLVDQMKERQALKEKESHLKIVHANLLKADTEDYLKAEKQKVEKRSDLMKRYKQELVSQKETAESLARATRDELSHDEILMNRQLIRLVQTTLPSFD
jgi:hypothetical protein